MPKSGNAAAALAALTITVTLSALTISATAEARQGVLRARGANGAVTAAAGAKGVATRGHGTVSNQDGSVTHGSGGAYRGVNGGQGYRASSTTVSPDGSVSRQTQAETNGPNGSVNIQGGLARGADGAWSGSRSTNATNASTGNSYSGSTTIDPATGQPVHTGGCTDAGGNAISCR